MSFRSNPVDTTPPKKRYQTPLNVVDLVRIEQQRERQLLEKMSRPEQQHGSPVSDTSMTNGEITSSDRSSEETPGTSHSSGSRAVMQNDAWLPYEKPARMRENMHFDFDFDQSKAAIQPFVKKDATAGNTPPKQPNRRITRLEINGPPLPPLPPEAQRSRRESERNTQRSSNVGISRVQKSNSRQRRLPSDHPNHPQRKTVVVPNYSRPWTPDFVRDRKHFEMDSENSNEHPETHMARIKEGDRTIFYESVNGVCLDSSPRSPNANQVGLSLPEIEARDIGNFLDDAPENRPIPPPKFDMTIPTSIRRAQIGPDGEFVRKVSSQPSIPDPDPSFTSNYVWKAEDSASDPSRVSSNGSMYSDDSDSEAVPPAIARNRGHWDEDAEISNRAENARSMFSDVLYGFFKPTNNDHRRHPPNSFQRNQSRGTGRFQTNGMGGNRNTCDFSIYDLDTERSTDSYSGGRRRVSFSGKNVMKMVTSR